MPTIYDRAYDEFYAIKYRIYTWFWPTLGIVHDRAGSLQLRMSRQRMAKTSTHLHVRFGSTTCVSGIIAVSSHTCTCTHTYAQTHIHTHMHKHTYTHICTRTRTRTRTHIHAPTTTPEPKLTHANTHTCPPPPPCTQTHHH